MNFLALCINIVLFLIGAYAYIFAIGKLQSKDPDMQKKVAAFRAENGWWLRLLGLALAAISIINIFLDIQGIL